MAKRVILLVHDDWEIRGNGTGNVAHLQYLPSLFLLKLARELGMRVTFMAEAMQQLAMRRFAERDRHLRIQTMLWEECLRLYREEGHDIQLHVHPHWHNAEYVDGFFRLGRNWNLATYPTAVRQEILRSAIVCLTEVLREVDPQHRVHAFKAGSWGLQPSRGLFEDLERCGIGIVIGAGRGISLHSADFHADYSALEEDVLPYYPDYDDVQKVAPGVMPIVVLPLPHYALDLAGTTRKLHRLVRRGRPGAGHDRLFYHDAIPQDVATNAPLVAASRASFLGLGSIRSLDVSGGIFEELRAAIDQIMERCLRTDAETVPLVIQGHTKGYPGRWDDVRRFYEYVVHRYGAVIEFMTLTEFRAALPEIPVRPGSRASGAPE